MTEAQPVKMNKIGRIEDKSISKIPVILFMTEQ